MKWRVEGSCISLEQRCSSTRSGAWPRWEGRGAQPMTSHRQACWWYLEVEPSPLRHCCQPHLIPRKECLHVGPDSLIKERFGWCNFYPRYSPHSINGSHPFKRLVRSIRFSSSHLGGLGWSKSLLSNQVLNALALVNKESNWNTTCG